MELQGYRDVRDFNVTHIHITLTDLDFMNAYRNMDSSDKHCLAEWGRNESSLEEKFMALQLIARKLD